MKWEIEFSEEDMRELKEFAKQTLKHNIKYDLERQAEIVKEAAQVLAFNQKALQLLEDGLLDEVDGGEIENETPQNNM